MTNQNRVIIFDTTLRDGEQSPGASMTFEEKLEVAHLLDMMGVDVIEAGFPIASEGDFESVSEISRRVKNASVCGLSRAAPNDIDRCAAAVKHAKRPRIHTFISTSPVHMKHKLQKTPEQVLELVAAQVTRARSHVADVEWSRKIIEAHSAASARGEGVVVVDGKLIENLHVESAKWVVAMAEAMNSSIQ